MREKWVLGEQQRLQNERLQEMLRKDDIYVAVAIVATIAVGVCAVYWWGIRDRYIYWTSGPEVKFTYADQEKVRWVEPSNYDLAHKRVIAVEFGSPMIPGGHFDIRTDPRIIRQITNAVLKAERVSGVTLGKTADLAFIFEDMTGFPLGVIVSHEKCAVGLNWRSVEVWYLLNKTFGPWKLPAQPSPPPPPPMGNLYPIWLGW